MAGPVRTHQCRVFSNRPVANAYRIVARTASMFGAQFSLSDRCLPPRKNEMFPRCVSVHLLPDQGSGCPMSAPCSPTHSLVAGCRPATVVASHVYAMRGSWPGDLGSFSMLVSWPTCHEFLIAHWSARSRVQGIGAAMRSSLQFPARCHFPGCTRTATKSDP